MVANRGGGGEGARICEDSQIERNSSAKISKQHCKREGNATHKPWKSPKGATLQVTYCEGKTADCISLSLTLPKLYLATFNGFTTNLVYCDDLYRCR